MVKRGNEVRGNEGGTQLKLIIKHKTMEGYEKANAQDKAYQK